MRIVLPSMRRSGRGFGELGFPQCISPRPFSQFISDEMRWGCRQGRDCFHSSSTALGPRILQTSTSRYFLPDMFSDVCIWCVFRHQLRCCLLPFQYHSDFLHSRLRFNTLWDIGVFVSRTIKSAFQAL